MSVARTASWDEKFPIDEFCKQNIVLADQYITSELTDCFLYGKPSRFIYSDASKTGCGSITTLNRGTICHKMWDDTESQRSANWRELCAI